ncbi:hypothetical protein JAAARDRAFT_50196 [Jaapia argillacea MUCL 33604]|uniref:Mediator of RNA polymerase II transcription subunit 25 n=1 Tax=Jaapia argillacea MUCL 33604 TaxID=933084 RepID=A0A067PC73_9AGAM|nr:hypothetical protein JAAARDRAFT_50196 [Jaapia argillacea MUCL 33604]
MAGANAMANSSSIFRPVEPGYPVAILFLIENSKDMVPYWPEIRNKYLPTLLGTLRLANPVVPIQVLILPSSPTANLDGKSQPDQIQYNELPELDFNPDLPNKVTPSLVQRAIDSLSGSFQDTPASRHLFIIAASGPGVDSPTLELSESGSDDPFAWQHLGDQLIGVGIYLHMILKHGGNDLDTFTELFNRTLLTQGNQEVYPWFNVDYRKYDFHLSAQPRFPLDPGSASVPFLLQPTSTMYDVPQATTSVPTLSTSGTTSISARQSFSRHNTFPASSYSSSKTAKPPSSPPKAEPANPKPSLVTRLKKMHGMTKTRNHGLSSSRQPFVRDDSPAESSSTPSSSSTASSPRSHPYLPTSSSSRIPHPEEGEFQARDGVRRRLKVQTMINAKAGRLSRHRHSGSLESDAAQALAQSLSTPSSPTSLTSPYEPIYLSPAPLSGGTGVAEAQSMASLMSPDPANGIMTQYANSNGSVSGSSTPIMSPVMTTLTWSQGSASLPLTPYSSDVSSDYASSIPTTIATDTGWGTNMASDMLSPINPPQSYLPGHTLVGLAENPPRASMESLSISSEADVAAPTTPLAVPGGNDPFIFDAEYEAEVNAHFQETIRAAGITPPVVPPLPVKLATPRNGPLRRFPQSLSEPDSAQRMMDRSALLFAPTQPPSMEFSNMQQQQTLSSLQVPLMSPGVLRATYAGDDEAAYFAQPYSNS